MIPRSGRGSPEPARDAGRARPDRALGLLGMATRAGTVIPGTGRVRDAARAGTLRLAIVASDASDNSRGKLLPLLTARGISHVIRYQRDELGAAIGRGPVSAAGVLDEALAGRLLALLADAGPDREVGERSDDAGGVGRTARDGLEGSGWADGSDDSQAG